jgi:hypothetical protein
MSDDSFFETGTFKFAVIFLSIFIPCWYYDQIYMPKYIKKNGIDGICTVTNGCGNNNRIEFDYLVKGRFYSKYLSSHAYIETGEKFHIKYLPDNPDRSEIDYYRPYLEDMLLTEKGAKIISIANWSDSGLIYKYSVDNQEYEYVRFYENVNTLDLDTSKWTLVYRKDTPNIAYVKPKE